jgi:hypothetical protein
MADPISETEDLAEVCFQLAMSGLSHIWDTPEEDEAWRDL